MRTVTTTTTAKIASRLTKIHYPNDFWDWLFTNKTIRKDLAEQGYYELDRVKVVPEYDEWRFSQQRAWQHRNPKNDSIPKRFNTPFPSSALSTDFYTQTPPLLKRNELYIVKTGNGNCLIFDEKKFPLPFLKLQGLHNDAIILPARLKTGYPMLLQALSAQWNEASFIKALHFMGVFSAIVRKVVYNSSNGSNNNCNGSYESGASGHVVSSFPFWMKNTRGKLFRFVHDGVVDLDECIYPRNTGVVMPVEAKIESDHRDMSWHKLAFPCYRFIDNSLAFRTFRTGSSGNSLPSHGRNQRTKIIPIFCLFQPSIKAAYVYVFPQIKILEMKDNNYYKQGCIEYGVVLNDEKQLTPKLIFQVDMKRIMQ